MELVLQRDGSSGKLPFSYSRHKLTIRSLTPTSSELSGPLACAIADQTGVNRISSTSSGMALLQHSNKADLQKLCRHGGVEGVATFDLLVSQLVKSLYRKLNMSSSAGSQQGLPVSLRSF